MDPSSGLAEANDPSAHPSRSEQSYSFTSAGRFTTARVWGWKKSGNQASSINTWKVSDDVRVRRLLSPWFLRPIIGAWFVVALYILHSVHLDHDPSINTALHLWNRNVFTRCSQVFLLFHLLQAATKGIIFCWLAQKKKLANKLTLFSLMWFIVNCIVSWVFSVLTFYAMLFFCYPWAL